MNGNFTYSGVSTLEVLRDAVNYNKFIEGELIAFIAPDKTAIDFGAGGGEFATRVRHHHIDVICIEPDSNQRRALESSGFKAHSSLAGAEPLNKIYTLNVLEHIEDDVTALKELHEKLNIGGSIFIYVPAFMALFSEFDSAIGHYRRYRRTELKQKLEVAGFTVHRAEYIDGLGFFCWLIMSKLGGDKKELNNNAVILFDRLIFPISRMIDKVTSRFFGKNLLMIAQKL
jgi:hypothetical protein